MGFNFGSVVINKLTLYNQRDLEASHSPVHCEGLLNPCAEQARVGSNPTASA